jgi:hypothetical protein
LKALDGEAFEAAVADWLEVADESGIALDGKTATGSGDPAKAWPALHLLSAYGGDTQATLASMPLDGKTHEHRQALQMLEIDTADRGRCDHRRRDVLSTGLIRESPAKKGDFLWQVKDNQPPTEAGPRRLVSAFGRSVRVRMGNAFPRR